MNKVLARYRATGRILSILNEGLERSRKKERKNGKKGTKSKRGSTQTLRRE